MSLAPARIPWHSEVRLRLQGLVAEVRELSLSGAADPSLTARIDRIGAAALARDGKPGSVVEVCALLGELSAVQAELRAQTLGSGSRILGRIHDALARIRDRSTPAAVVAAAPAELCVACGLDRAMISRLLGSTWIPQALHVVRNAGDPVDAALRDFVRDVRIPLTASMPEAELVRRRVPALVGHAQSDMRTFRPLIEVSGTRSYVMAPIVASGAVVGFLHADTHTSGRTLTTVDRDNLHTFAEGFGLIFERAVLFGRLASQRTRIGTAFSATAAMLDELCGAPVQLNRARRWLPEPKSAAELLFGDPGPTQAGPLTPRQREVLDLLVAGSTNIQIADQLTVAETTVKSHVKQILRKLGAANRSEAIARYMHLVRDQRRAAS